MPVAFCAVAMLLGIVAWLDNRWNPVILVFAGAALLTLQPTVELGSWKHALLIVAAGVLGLLGVIQVLGTP